jgi:hypothetical protein
MKILKYLRHLAKYKAQARELSIRLKEKDKARLTAESNARFVTDDYIFIAQLYHESDEANARLQSIVNDQEEFITELRNRIILHEKELKIACGKLTEARTMRYALKTDLTKAVKRCEKQIQEDARKSIEHERTRKNLNKARRIINDIFPQLQKGWSKIDENLEMEIQEAIKDVA